MQGSELFKQGEGPPIQNPFWHWSFCVHQNPSSQVELLGRLVKIQVELTQESWVQGLLSLHCELFVHEQLK